MVTTGINPEETDVIVDANGLFAARSHEMTFFDGCCTKFPAGVYPATKGFVVDVDRARMV